MPKENKKRGRRAEAQKRKADESEIVDEEITIKRQRTIDGDSEGLQLDNTVAAPDQGEATHADGEDPDRPFYGLLDEQEQEYFKRADDMLEVNQFEDADERSLFLANVYKEAEGKELKLACSQSSSRLLERLILVSSPAQLKKLFQKFNGHFLNLVQHRFASHCCETLFSQSAQVVTDELLMPADQENGVPVDEEPIVSMENLFLYAINELQGNLGFLLTDRFGSHALRVLLVVLSGQPLESSSSQPSILRSRKKENIDVSKSQKSENRTSEKRSVPQSFMTALEKMINDSVLGLDATYLRALATHQIGNPMLQLLLQLELTHFGKQRGKDEASIIRKLLPDDPLAEGTDSARFINGLVYDPVGSRLLEAVVEFAPGKMFKTLYKEFFRERMGSLARNEIAGYVVAKILERLSSEDLQKAHDAILPQIPSLAERGRTSILRTLVERCAARDVDTTTLAAALKSAYSDDNGETFSITKLLNMPSDSEGLPLTPGGLPQPQPVEPRISPTEPRQPPVSSPKHNKPAKPLSAHSGPVEPIKTTPATLHASLLAQAMLKTKTPGPLSELIFDALMALDSLLCLRFAYTPILSPILQTSLTTADAPIIFRRKLITRFYSNAGSLSLDPSGSHFVDAIWGGTQGMAFVRERIAEELAENEGVLRDSGPGRKVWRNWRMDLYKRRRNEWVKNVRGEVGNDGFLSFPGGVQASEDSLKEKSLSHGEARAVKGNGFEGIQKSAGKEEGGKHGSHANGGNGVYGRWDNGATGRKKSKLDLARERYSKNAKAQSQGQAGSGRRESDAIGST